MPIYTKQGDTGETSIFDGARVPKNDAKIELLGHLDELNSALGVVLVYLKNWQQLARDRQLDAKALEYHYHLLLLIQSTIFELGSELAQTKTPSKNYGSLTGRIERTIDILTDQLPPLRNFILPGGSPGAAYTHLARTVCRRTERRFFTLSSERNASAGQLLNRLSDYLFMLARWFNKQSQVADIIWRPSDNNDQEI
jgi:cob(I)alamin adenosyltransferase